MYKFKRSRTRVVTGRLVRFRRLDRIKAATGCRFNKPPFHFSVVYRYKSVFKGYHLWAMRVGACRLGARVHWKWHMQMYRHYGRWG